MSVTRFGRSRVMDSLWWMLFAARISGAPSSCTAFLAGASIFPVLSERRVLLAWAPYARGVQARVLEAEIDDFFHDATADPHKSWSMLRHHRVTHVIEITGDRINPRIREQLTPVLVTPMYRLLAVPRETGCVATQFNCR